MTQPKIAFGQVRLSTKDKKRVEAIASHDGVTVSEFVRRVIRAELVDKKGEW